MAPRTDPYTDHSFRVEIDGIVTAAFHEVSGLGERIDIIEYRMGSDPEAHTRKLPGLRHFDDVTLKRGVVQDLQLWQWLNSDPPERRNVAVILLDDERNVVLRFLLHDAWPCRWEGPHLNATGTGVAIETLVLCHERLDIDAD